MNRNFGISLILGGALLVGGCATKKYVQQTAVPIQSQVNQVTDQANKERSDIDTAKVDIERHETGISAARERAMSAEKAAADAMSAAKTADATANEARDSSNRNTQAITKLQTALGSLDDYKFQAETVVLFTFGHDELSSEAKEQLDTFVREHANARRYFITIEGFTDKTGSDAYNDALSLRRAERVMAYLVTQHNIPVFRIQDIGLGKEKPADEERERAARAKNRRVEVRLFSGDQQLAKSQAQAE